MTYVLVAVVCLGLGFVAGVLVWRNNAKRFSEFEAEARRRGKDLSDILTF